MVVVGGDQREALEQALLGAEEASGKATRKWQKTIPARRIAYLRRVAVISHAFLLAYRAFSSQGEYIAQTGQAIVAAIRAVEAPSESTVIVTIDGLNPEARNQLRREISRLTPHSKKLRGGRDESSALLRLADALAGFIRHVRRTETYTEGLFDLLSPVLIEV